jgi:hypothetical protein
MVIIVLFIFVLLVFGFCRFVPPPLQAPGQMCAVPNAGSGVARAVT